MNVMDKLCQLRFKDEKMALGLMSGTSLDGVSIAIVKLKGSWVETKFKIMYHATYEYSPELRREIFRVVNPKTGNVKRVCQLNHALGRVYAEKALKAIDEAGLDRGEIDFIASHGQTVYHNPKIDCIAGYKSRSTLQIGEPAVIAHETGIITIADFRQGDVAAGGHGAPISAYADYIIFRSMNLDRAIQNIGGIANVTWMPKGGGLDDVIAFDTGPGNMVIDALIEEMTGGRARMDVDGEIASRGDVNMELLNYMMKHPYLSLKPPKTTGREDFGWKFTGRVLKKALNMGLSWEDIIATATYYTAKTISEAYGNYLPRKPNEIILGGGGSRNKTLVEMIRELNPDAKVSLHEDYGIPAQAKEPLIMTILANETLSGNPSNVPKATGATGRAILGKIILP